jgi:hypothetical protein
MRTPRHYLTLLLKLNLFLFAYLTFATPASADVFSLTVLLAIFRRFPAAAASISQQHRRQTSLSWTAGLRCSAGTSFFAPPLSTLEALSAATQTVGRLRLGALSNSWMSALRVPVRSIKANSYLAVYSVPSLARLPSPRARGAGFYLVRFHSASLRKWRQPPASVKTTPEPFRLWLLGHPLLARRTGSPFHPPKE